MLNAYKIKCALESGLGAVKLGGHVKSIKLTYPRIPPYVDGSHQFFQNYMPKLKYNNPEIDMKVKYVKEEAPSKIEIVMTNGKSSTLDVSQLPAETIVLKLVETIANKA